ncbi:MAG: peptidase M3, partial [Duncaniella sp.]|nr:peptidase M3 [Duncaniella sp.]
MSAETQRVNPFMAPYGTKYDIPPFEQIQYADYLPAVEKGIAERRAEIKAIADNPATPTFDNTILAMEKAGSLLTRVTRVFNSLLETDNTPEMQALSETILPMVASSSDEISMDPKLFARVKSLYDRRNSLGLEPYQKRAIELSYQNFVRNGALLSAAEKEELMKVNQQLTDLYLQFNKNLLASTNSFELVVDNEADLAGIPAGIIATAATEAKERGKDGKWVFTLHAPSRLPVLKYAANRGLREKMYNGYMQLASTA